MPPRQIDQLALDQRHLLRRHFYAEVAARHHDGVRGLDNGFDVFHRLRRLDLGDDRRRRTCPPDQPPQAFDIPGGAHEGQRQVIDAEADGKLGVGNVLRRQRGCGDFRVGQVDALVVLEQAAEDHFAANAFALDFQRLQLQVAIVKQDAVTGPDVMRDGPVLRSDEAGAAILHPRVDHHLVTGNQLQRAVGKPAAADLGAAEVGEDRHMPAEFVGRRPHVVIDLAVCLVRAVRHVEPHDIDPGAQQPDDHRRI